MLRVIDFEDVSALHSQTLWHAIAYGVSEGSPNTLSFMRPKEAYVSLGFHRRFEEINSSFCQNNQLPIYRRMVGGGPVYLDNNQLFFQIVVPAKQLPFSRQKAIHNLLAPAVQAFQQVGLDAHLDENLEVVVGDRKICGHGAGQIEDAAVLVGNLIQDFDHRLATNILNIENEILADEVFTLMKRYVALDKDDFQVPNIDSKLFISAAVDAYGQAFDLEPVFQGLTEFEKQKLKELDAQFVESEWVRGMEPRPSATTRIKIRADVWACATDYEGTKVIANLIKGSISNLQVFDKELNGSRDSIQSKLEGLSLSQARDYCLGLNQDVGTRLAEALGQMGGPKV